MGAVPDEKRVPVRELRNHGGEVLARVQSGQTLTITNDGVPVAELRPLPRRSLAAAELVARRRWLPPVDTTTLRSDIDAVLDQSL